MHSRQPCQVISIDCKSRSAGDDWKRGSDEEIKRKITRQKQAQRRQEGDPWPLEIRNDTQNVANAFEENQNRVEGDEGAEKEEEEVASVADKFGLACT